MQEEENSTTAAGNNTDPITSIHGERRNSHVYKARIGKTPAVQKRTSKKKNPVGTVSHAFNFRLNYL